MTQRYTLYPGPVTSRTDGQVHYVSAAELAALYRVNPRDCLVVTQADLCRPDLRDRCARAAELVALRPRRSGNYSRPALAPALLVASCWSCPACGYSQRGGLPASCPINFPQAVCPLGKGTP